MYAVVDIAGKQFKVSQAQRLVVPKLLAEPGEVLTFDRVLLLASSPDGAGKVTTDSVGTQGWYSNGPRSESSSNCSLPCEG